MRHIHAWLYVTLDGVYEAPENWVIADDGMFAANEADYGDADALLLGRRTYEIFAASWPERGSDVPNADWMNSTRKYVVSTTLENPEWHNSTVIRGDLPQQLTRLKEQAGKTIIVNGSATLIRSLLHDGLLDELRLFVHPLVIGSGQRLFSDDSDKVELALIESQTYDNGVVSLRYRPRGNTA